MEMPDLPFMFAPQPELTAEQKAHLERVHTLEHEGQAERMAELTRLAPILCNCRRRYDREDSDPPQLGCYVHGSLMVHPCTGEIIYPGIGPIG
jgi:hypothetical protein